MTTAAAGMLEGHSLQTLLGDAEEKEVVGENWHHGMLNFLGARLLPMVTTAYERATKKMRDAFVYQIEKNMAKHSQPQDGEQELALPGDILAETILKFIEATIQLPVRAPVESREEQITNRKQAAISLEHVGFMKTAKPQLPTMEGRRHDKRWKRDARKMPKAVLEARSRSAAEDN